MLPIRNVMSVSYLALLKSNFIYIIYWSLRVTVDFLYNLTINSQISSMYLLALWIPNSIFLGVMLVLSEVRFRKLMSRRWESKVPNLGFFKKAITQNYLFIFFFLRNWNLAIFWWYQQFLLQFLLYDNAFQTE